MIMDPRLQHLPGELVFVAADFLTLNWAWGTDFIAKSEVDLSILWREESGTFVARFEYLAPCSWSDGYWNAWIREWLGPVDEHPRRENAVRWSNAEPTLRRLPEFSEFVQRFRTP